MLDIKFTKRDALKVIITLGILVFCLILFPTDVFAETIDSQTVNNTNELSDSGSGTQRIYEVLRSGLDDVVYNVSFYAYGIGLEGNETVYVILYDCGLSPCVLEEFNFTNSTGQVAQTTAETLAGSLQYYYQSFVVPYDLDPTHYYLFNVRFENVGLDSVYVGGDSSSSYPGGCYENAGSPYPVCDDIDDIYFVLSDATGFNGVTRIESTIPDPDSEVATSTNFAFGVDGYVNDDEYNDGYFVYLRYRQLTGAGLRGNSIVAEYGDFSWLLSSGGLFSVSTTTPIQSSGEYLGYVAIKKPLLSFFGFDVGSRVVVEETFKFTVATSTDIEKKQALNTLISSLGSNASTTQAITPCSSFLSNDFDFADCLYSIFIPSSEDVAEQVEIALSGYMTYFPLGYLTDFYNTISTSTVAEELGIHAVIPNGLPGAGATLDLTLSSTSLAWLYDSDIGSFVTSEQSDTRSFYDITYDYWKWMVYLAVTIYLIYRILGSRVLPFLGDEVGGEVRSRRILARKRMDKLSKPMSKVYK